MTWVSNLVRSLRERGLLQYLPVKLLKHYLYPLTVRKGRIAYDPVRYFSSWYNSQADSEFTDRLTVSARTSVAQARFHYNATENSILRFFARRQPPDALRVLDVGSGAGHWIDFYLDVFSARRVVGLELVPSVCQLLQEKYRNDPRVEIRAEDVSAPQLSFAETFDLVNAIGVMFHIVDDFAWFRALRHVADHLEPGGRFVAGGQFGHKTGDVQFHGRDEFDRYDDQYLLAGHDEVLVNKRIRSLRFWRREARRVGLQLEAVIRTQGDRAFVSPENHVAVFRRTEST